MKALKDAKHSINLIAHDILALKMKPWAGSKLIINEYWRIYYELRVADKKPFEEWFRKRYDKLQRDHEGGRG